MIILDADSLMTGDTILRLVSAMRRMAASRSSKPCRLSSMQEPCSRDCSNFQEG